MRADPLSRPEGFRETVSPAPGDAYPSANLDPIEQHVVCHRQCGREVPLEEEVEDLIRVRSRSAENALSKRFGRGQPLKYIKGLWVCITDDVEYLRPDTGYLVLCRDSEKGRECGEIRYFVWFGESVDRDDQWNNSLTKEHSSIHWEICDLQKRGEIGSRVRERNAGTTVGRFRGGQIRFREELAQHRGVERKDACVDTEQSVRLATHNTSTFPSSR